MRSWSLILTTHPRSRISRTRSWDFSPLCLVLKFKALTIVLCCRVTRRKMNTKSEALCASNKLYNLRHKCPHQWGSGTSTKDKNILVSLAPARASSCNTTASRLMDWTAVAWSEHINKFWIASWFCPWDLLQAAHLTQHRRVHTFLAGPAGCARNKGQWEKSSCVVSVIFFFFWLRSEFSVLCSLRAVDTWGSGFWYATDMDISPPCLRSAPMTHP